MISKIKNINCKGYPGIILSLTVQEINLFIWLEYMSHVTTDFEFLVFSFYERGSQEKHQYESILEKEMPKNRVGSVFIFPEVCPPWGLPKLSSVQRQGCWAHYAVSRLSLIGRAGLQQSRQMWRSNRRRLFWKEDQGQKKEWFH